MCLSAAEKSNQLRKLYWSWNTEPTGINISASESIGINLVPPFLQYVVTEMSPQRSIINSKTYRGSYLDIEQHIFIKIYLFYLLTQSFSETSPLKVGF